MKAVMMLSGGLDSRLAMKMMLDQGVELHAYNHTTAFCTCTSRASCRHEAVKAAQEFDVPLTVKNVTEEFLRIIEDPEHGYGSGVNPCIDCRIMLFRGARRLMEEVGGRFVVTGEVLGERPMSQRRDAMEHIERESGLDGLVLRPLCAKAMEPTVPEREGWVDREKLEEITGRRRVPQIELAEELGVRDYPCPAGGCRLTDPGYAARMRDLLEHERPLQVNDVQLLRVGRHFRLDERARVIVGRDEDENAMIDRLSRPADHKVELADVPGPLTVVRGTPDAGHLRTAAAMTARYSKARDRESVEVGHWQHERENATMISVAPAQDEELSPLRIAR